MFLPSHLTLFIVSRCLAMCCILIVWTGCSTLQAQSSLEVGTLWHVASQKPVSLESLEADILEADVVFIGAASKPVR